MTNDRLNAPPSLDQSPAQHLVETRFVPRQYEPNYAYPLLVLFHARGGDEDQLVRAMPALSWRNYVGLGLRGPEPVIKRDRLAGFGWGRDFELHDRLGRDARPVRPAAEIVRQALFDPEPDDFDRLEEGVFTAIRKTRSLLHIHSERIFLVGCGEGAAAAYRFGLSYPERFAGVVADQRLAPHGLPSAGADEGLSGSADPRRPRRLEHQASARLTPAAMSATLRAGGLRVAFQTYPCATASTARCSATWIPG